MAHFCTTSKPGYSPATVAAAIVQHLMAPFQLRSTAANMPFPLSVLLATLHPLVTTVNSSTTQFAT
ncbi:hypothetical protein ABT56_15165 [Photobacterium aquae]|uniref:Uncharacterized protein n=1 Tax=Photobacterium aquae TaxID=1195763 RepID=A0A0J1GXT1_9GAMM|nr:hypothetical protein [Photobacterium aquae]KLV04470.1 hypothetical protein ABT56_15165 [Photobacterium aquae]